MRRLAQLHRRQVWCKVPAPEQHGRKGEKMPADQQRAANAKQHKDQVQRRAREEHGQANGEGQQSKCPENHHRPGYRQHPGETFVCLVECSS
jgi:hypothetical protein